MKQAILFLILFLFSNGAFVDPLPEYVIFNNESQALESRNQLLKRAKEVKFPLDVDTQKELSLLSRKYDSEGNIAGLAAPQIGLDLRAFVFAIPDDKELKKWRPDIVETFDKSIWLNPSYKRVGKETSVDFEACFSIADKAGPVRRPTRITYQAFLEDGTKISGQASGYAARVIQHEIDHLDGILYTSLVEPGKLISIAEYTAMRAKATQKQEL